ncbi:TPA: MATE family efflux transporter, partial [Streptococcus equi subsp. zooepidemicus]|nr:MATE family efflux transporter [Streptococcus equi subsp. zooepidemicus]
GVGSSAMMMQILFMIQQTMLYKMSFKYGGDTNAILMAATLRIYAFSFIPLWGMSQGLQPVVGTNFGAKKYDRVKEAMKVFSIGGLVLASIFWIPALAFSKNILSLFGVEESIITQGIGNFRLFYSIFILYGVMVMTITFFQSIGNAKKAGIIVMLRQLFLFVPAMIILPMIFGVKAVWFA